MVNKLIRIQLNMNLGFADNLDMISKSLVDTVKAAIVSEEGTKKIGSDINT